jgi:hypothetical protein
VNDADDLVQEDDTFLLEDISDLDVVIYFDGAKDDVASGTWLDYFKLTVAL